MTSNILSAVSSFLTPELVGKMASAAGVDRSMAQKGVTAAVPTILAGLANAAARPGGAQQLANTLADQPPNILANITNSITGSAQMADRGRSTLSSLLGTGMLGPLISALSRYIGIGEGSMRTLTGLLAPVIMGVLGREQRANGLDANGLARMLTEQKGDLTAAIPSGLSNLLQQSGLFESASYATSAERPRVYETSRSTYDQPTESTAHRAAVNGRSQGVTWPYWVLPLIALGGLLWYMLPRVEPEHQAAVEPTRNVEPTRTAQQPTTQTTAPSTAPAAGDKATYLTKAPDNWVSVADYANKDIYNQAGETIGTVKDLLIGPDGKVAAAVIAVGRSLGLGEKTVAVPFSALHVERKDDTRRIVVDTAKNALEAAPTFEPRVAPKT